MSGSFKSVRRNACVHRLDLVLYSLSKEFWGMESEPVLFPRAKSPLQEAQRRVEPATLHHADRELITLPPELFRPPTMIMI